MMTLSHFERGALGLSGLSAVAIGAAIMAAPHAVYASYGISPGHDPSMLSELRAMAAALVTLGALMLAGIWRSAMAPLAIAAAFVVYLAFPAGRLIGLAVDGVPSSGIIAALVFEIIVAAFCVLALRHRILRALSGPAAAAARP